MFKVLGIDRDQTDCECCGKTNLKLTVVLGKLDADKNVVETLRFGRDCAARATLLRRTGAAMEVLAEETHRRAEEEKTRRVVVLSDTGVNVTWVVESVGQNGAKMTRLCFAKGLRSEVQRWAETEYPHNIINVRKAV